MRFEMRSGLLAAAALALVWSVPAGATDIKIPGKIGMVKPGLFKIVSKPVGAFTIPAPGSGTDPLIVGGDVHVFDTDGTGDLFDDLTGFPVGEGWSGLGNPPGISGYKYKCTTAPTGCDVKIIIFKPTVIKILAKATDTLSPPIGGNLGVELINGTDRRCADFGGTTIKNVATPTPLFKRKDAPAPASCPVVTVCCSSASHLNFSTITAPGDCGDVIDAAGMVVTNINCAGLYTGGGGQSVPLPYALPDLGNAVTAVTGCAADVVTVGGTSSTATGSIKNCTNPGCRFGAPLTVPNPITTPVSVCVVNEVATAPSGTVNCANGATSISLPLSSEIFLTGDKNGAAGIQPCPRCLAGSCVGGANDMGICVAGTTAINSGYPTSNDCPPDGSDSIGSLPVAFALSSGTVTWTGNVATNDTNSTASSQTRVYAGYCRDVALPGGTGSFDASGTAGNQFKQCWENGMAVGTACSEANNGAESCEQRTTGAFGPNGGANRTIRAIGNAMSILGGPAPATLVSVFAIPPTFDATIDGAGDLPGPGAVAIPGTARTCTTANPCP